MENGYVKIYRTLLNKGYYQDSEYVHLWVHLIMKATYQSREYLFNNKIEKLNAGQFICGRKSLSKETGINESKIERILKCFENEQQIEQQTNSKFRIISIVNWNEYQTTEQQIEQPVNSERTTGEQLVNTNNKEKKDKKDKNKYTSAFLSFYSAYPKHIGREPAWQAWKKLNGTCPDVQIIIAKIEEMKKSDDWLKDNGKFIPHPATWLNQKRWEDEGVVLEKKSSW